ncbi:putative UDP-glycosyltransferase [Halocaridina rubra]|uniref:UDP-glucuronosyltransferase n=1 Tax=Halocaridina rubra TaxID=373956 RepID=A0AAN8WV64_HALRR
MLAKHLIFLFITLTQYGVSESAKILVLHPMYAGSHIFTLRALALSLVDEGHEVVVVRWKDSHNYPAFQHPNITEEILAINNTDGNVPYLTRDERASFLMPQELMWGKGTSWTALPVDAYFTVSAFCSSLLERDSLREELKRQKFDVAIVDLIFNECSLALAHNLGLPSVGYWAFTFAGGEPQYTTAFCPPSAVPFILSHYDDDMTLWQRIFNHFLAFASHIVMQTQFLVTNYQIQQYLPGTPSPANLLANISGMLINSHPAVDYPRLLPPSFLNVGGLQMHTPKPLPAELEHFISGSGDSGVVLFTMGFIFNPKVVPQYVVKAFMVAFGRLRQRVLMKLEEDYPNPPPNVKVVKWLPQQDILAHPKTVLFFTHCGMHGVMEALHHGVPMVGMPVFADQKDVLVRLEQKGVAKGVRKYATQEEIYNAITEVISNPRYRENARRISHIMKDNPVEPLKKAVWLVNHVIETKGAEHLKFSGRHLNWIQLYGLDVLAMGAIVFYVLGFHAIPLLRKSISPRKIKIKVN